VKNSPKVSTTNHHHRRHQHHHHMAYLQVVTATQQNIKCVYDEEKIKKPNSLTLALNQMGEFFFPVIVAYIIACLLDTALAIISCNFSSCTVTAEI